MRPGATKNSAADEATPATRAGPRERNPRGEGARLRSEILTSAAELLDETGTEEAVTLRAVARRVGIAAPSIYGHFPDRQAILLAIVQNAFAELSQQLTATAAGVADPVRRLQAVCAAYLHFAATRPQRYRAMFGGVWNATQALDSAAVTTTSVTPADVATLGQDALALLQTSLQECVDAHRSTSIDPNADAIALWLGLHGLAHQRAVAAAFPWPTDITDRLVTPLAHLLPPDAPTTHQTGKLAAPAAGDPAVGGGGVITPP